MVSLEVRLVWDGFLVLQKGLNAPGDALESVEGIRKLEALGERTPFTSCSVYSTSGSRHTASL